MRCFVAGGAGFIGSNLVRRLLDAGRKVTVFDNLSGGKKEFINCFLCNKNFNFVKGDLLNEDLLEKSIKGHDTVFHFAASSDISLGASQNNLDLKNGFLTTFNILRAMVSTDVKKIVFASSGSIYGENAQKGCSEDMGPVLPLSLYAASKAASEAYISAFCNVYGLKAWIFRFANIVGPNATHGVVFDFVRKLKKDPSKLVILGDGKQTKPYLYVEECLDGIFYALRHSKEKINYFNVSSNDTIDVKSIAAIVIRAMDLRNVSLEFTGGKAGWPGDQSKISMDALKINRLGWKAKMPSGEAVKLAAGHILGQV